MKKLRITLILFIVFSSLTMKGSACSISLLGNDQKTLIARNMDWPEPTGMVLKNLSGIEKTAMLSPDGSTPYTWTSSYGSITFDLVVETRSYGELSAPGCGLNEAGFYAATLFVDPPKYPGPGSKPFLSCIEVARVLLDTCSNVSEALSKFNEFGITGLVIDDELSCDMHWFLADKEGNCAIVEFPPENSGTISVNYPGKKCMTNDYYGPSYANLARYQGFGGTLPIPSDEHKRTSDVRFVRDVYFSEEVMAKEDISKDDGFFVMGKVAQTEGTKGSDSPTDWTIVYDLKGLNLSWTAVNNELRRDIDLTRLDFSSSEKVTSMDIQSSGSGDVTSNFGEKTEGTSSGCNVGATSCTLALLLVPLVFMGKR